MSRSRVLAASLALGGVLAAIAFGAAGGTELGRTTTTEALIVLGAGAFLALASLHPRAGLPHGGAAALLFVVLTAVTALSMAWSIAPGTSLEEASRTFAYLAVFAVALMAARLAPRATPAVLGGVLLATVAVAGWALVTRVWPDALAGDVLGARLGEPFGYWNALGSMAALGIPAGIWLAARRGGVTSALAYPALGVLLLAVLLTQSRGALAAAAVAVVVWLAFVPLRLRTVPAIALPVLGAGPIAAWALSKDAFTQPLQAPSAREAVAGEFGLMVLAMCAGLLAAGLAVSLAGARRPPSVPVRRRAGVALAVVACALPLVALTSVAFSDRGIGGTIADRVEQLTDEEEAPPEGAARLGSLSSTRGSYWGQAADVFDERPWIGVGAGGFALASLPYRESASGAKHAHGFVSQTMADLGIVGLAASLALLAAWLAAAARSTGLLPRGRPRPPWTEERAAVTALALCAVAFGLQSIVDWTWFVPGPAVAGLVAAGFVAGRGPLRRLGEHRTPGSEPEGGRLGGLLPAGRPSTPRAIVAAAVLVTAVLCAWAVWQPERAARANDRTYELLDEGRTEEAARQARDARDIDPYSPDPFYALAAVQARRNRTIAAHRTLEQAVLEHPRDPEPWLHLARFELETLDLPDRAIQSTLGALRVDPNSARAKSLRERAGAERTID